VTDVEHHIGETLPMFTAPARAILHASSPMSFVAALRAKPVFLFHADDDSTIPAADVQALVDAMKPAHARSTLVTVPSGEHYESMIKDGIPAAARWLERM
jgi:fermentation-respiration switch protein FrsA (DUF1100 family)